MNFAVRRLPSAVNVMLKLTITWTRHTSTRVVWGRRYHRMACVRIVFKKTTKLKEGNFRTFIAKRKRLGRFYVHRLHGLPTRLVFNVNNKVIIHKLFEDEVFIYNWNRKKFPNSPKKKTFVQNSECIIYLFYRKM